MSLVLASHALCPYNAHDEAALAERAAAIRARIVRLESTLSAGPYFDGAVFRIVDAVFAPVFRYFDGFDSIDDFGFWIDAPKTLAWRHALAARPSVITAVQPDHPQRLARFVAARGSALSRRQAGRATATSP